MNYHRPKCAGTAIAAAVSKMTLLQKQINKASGYVTTVCANVFFSIPIKKIEKESEIVCTCVRQKTVFLYRFSTGLSELTHYLSQHNPKRPDCLDSLQGITLTQHFSNLMLTPGAVLKPMRIQGPVTSIKCSGTNRKRHQFVHLNKRPIAASCILPQRRMLNAWEGALSSFSFSFFFLDFFCVCVDHF